ncbi:hypothetical protein RXV86_04435 [Alisedimentitalea sp. MJ-SS2]|uniref:hypothetical protein n=1 Tax=Aliisedimentitalea sp. MJ-SS2 TaxID=3049795 RepID=UPI0029081616|nr:hypothetical protein [Alisedimentitalea sp. MJ-SS2]MDU8926626.1 hypothetical protein [Alisedimentitalea sp. MJ-SS2]
MYAQKLRLSDIRYNPEREGFEAKVAVHDRGTVWFYPAFAAAPLNAEAALISRRLSEAALRAHKSARPGLRMHSRPLATSRPLAA